VDAGAKRPFLEPSNTEHCFLPLPLPLPLTTPTALQVCRLTTLDELKSYADDWDRLAVGSPFRSWTWLSTWWRTYGWREGDDARRQLNVLCVFDDADALIGVVPMYLECSAVWGRVLRLLGDGEICSDYLGVLCEPDHEAAVSEALAEYLVSNALSDDADALRWDLIEWEGVDAGDRVAMAFTARMTLLQCELHQHALANCWRLPLPTDWEVYIESLGRNLRRDIRQLTRNYWMSGRVALHTVERLPELSEAMDILIDLHTRRRESLGDSGCFASERFRAFCREVMPELLREGRLQMHWLELDCRPAAVECLLVDGGIWYMYQGGIEPAAAEHQPGKLIHMAILRRAIESGVRAFDFLRGDELYKSRYGAKPSPCLRVRLVPPRPLARLRHHVWLAGRSVKEWARELKMKNAE
jgi:CelD/BcsL family acetyltransferase involved in cellulose biosynthesis